MDHDCGSTVYQSVTYRYREFPVPGISNFVGGLGKIWYWKKSRNRYRKNLVPELIFFAKILEFRRFIIGTGTVLVSVPGICHFSGGIGTGIGKIWYRKKVSEPVSVKLSIGKKSRNRYRENLVPKKVPVSVSKIFGTG